MTTITEDQVFEYTDALDEHLDAIEFERLAQGLPANPWRFMSLSHFRLSATHMRHMIEDDGLTALNQLRFGEFKRDLAKYGLADEDGNLTSGPIVQRPTLYSQHDHDLHWARRQAAEAKRLLAEERAFLFPSDDVIADALGRVYSGSPVAATEVAAALSPEGRTPPHSIVVRVGLALSRLAAAGRAVGISNAKAHLPKRWEAVVDA